MSKTKIEYPWATSQRQLQLGLLLTAVIVFVPSILWLVGSSPTEIWGSPSNVFRSIAKCAAFSGLSLFAWTSILGLRIPLINKLFGGFVRKYKVHAKLGSLAFVLIGMHVVGLIIAYGLSERRSFLDALDPTNIVVLAGYVAFIMVLVGGYFSHKKITHKNWIRIHHLLAFVVPVSFFHALLARSELLDNRLLAVFLAIMVSQQIGTYVYYVFLKKFNNSRYSYTVAEVNHPNATVTELVLKPESGEDLDYEPGQFVFLGLESVAVDREAHPFTVANADNGPYLRIAIKALGDWTTGVASVKVGEKATIEGPFGNFTFDRNSARPIVWIAGGVGITPFLSMARSIDPKTTSRVELFYAAKDLADSVFLDELFEISKLRPEILDVTIIPEKLSGFLELADIQHEISNLCDADYFICGPPGMMRAMRKSLLSVGVNPSQIHSEEFSF